MTSARARRLAGRAAVVFGASRGIGKGIALALAAEGAHVTVAARREGDRQFPGQVEETVAEIRAVGGGAEAAYCDISDSADVAGAVRAAADRSGRLDIAVNSAVFINYDKMLEIDDATWRRGFEINVHGAFFLTREAAKVMIPQGGGHIIHLTGSGARDVGVVNELTGASKAALERLVRGAAEELRPHKIAVNLFDPGGVKTERATVLRRSNIDWSRFPTPADVAPAAVHIALQDPAAMTGQIYSYSQHVGGKS